MSPESVDPLAQVVALLRPRAVFSKTIEGAGRWAVRYAAFGQPAFCAMLEGRCRLTLDGGEPTELEAGDFVLLPTTPAFTMSSFEPTRPILLDPRRAPAGDIRHGRREGPPDVRQFGGYFSFGSPDSALLVALLPRMLLVRGVPRLARFVTLLGEEVARDEVGRSLVLERLVEILLVEALRAVPRETASAGLLRGLADARVAVALRRIHGDVERSWTVAELAREAGMSRSAFFQRFATTVGVRPMAYLLAWRMAVAKDLLQAGALPLDDVARRVGYGSPATFSTAFSRHVGVPPGRFRRAGASALASTARTAVEVASAAAPRPPRVAAARPDRLEER